MSNLVVRGTGLNMDPYVRSGRASTAFAPPVAIARLKVNHVVLFVCLRQGV